MDSTLAALVARYPRVRWTVDEDMFRGVSGHLHLRVWQESDGWCADGWIGGRADTVIRAVSPAAALDELATVRPEYGRALHAAPVQPMRAEHIPPTPEQLATAQTPQSTPFPPLLLRSVWAALWPDVAALLLLGAMALACGALGMWTITGGAR